MVNNNHRPFWLLTKGFIFFDRSNHNWQDFGKLLTEVSQDFGGCPIIYTVDRHWMDFLQYFIQIVSKLYCGVIFLANLIHYVIFEFVFNKYTYWV